MIISFKWLYTKENIITITVLLFLHAVVMLRCFVIFQ